MSSYEIVDEYGYKYKNIVNKVIDKTLEIENVDNAIFTIILVDNEKIHELNKTYRGIDRPTDVISFAYEDNEEKKNEDFRVLGEIFISIPKMKEQAKEYGHSEERELCFLLVHGLLHLLGYDHQTKEDEVVMFGKQEVVLNEFEETKKERKQKVWY